MMLHIPTDFTFREKQAILAMLWLAAGCDGRIGTREYLFFMRVSHAFGMPYEEDIKARSVFENRNWQSEMQLAYMNISKAHKSDARRIIKRMVEIDENPDKLQVYEYLHQFYKYD